MTARSVALPLALLLAVSGCEEEAPPEGERGAREEQALQEARAGAKKLGKTLKGRLVTAMEEGGPSQAIDVCATQAQELTAEVARDTGVKVGRSSLRLRNPGNAPPSWVRPWLEEQGERKAEGVEGFARVDEVDGQQRARVLIPIAVEGPCVTCHGPREQIPDEVRTVLSEQYPKDEAVGYEVGDLRGALWAEAPVR